MIETGANIDICFWQREGISNVFSYVQIRGSGWFVHSLLLLHLTFPSLFYVVPLFWTQSGYGLKPPPLLAPDRSHAQNLDTIRRHFKRTVPQYGPHVGSVLHNACYSVIPIDTEIGHREPS